MPKTKTYDERHGGPYDRGGADSWYRRPRNPHYFVGGSYDSEPILPPQMTQAEIDAYNAGFDAGEASGDHKEW